MGKRNDISSVLIIGSGPIVIGQACEFDYSGTQAIRALKEEGLRVILVNSNPATIMTDPELADRTYIEPLTVATIEKVIERERPDAVLPTMGGQTALNLALELEEKGIFERAGVKLIGASVQAIKTAEDRDAFKAAMDEIGIESARSVVVRAVSDAIAFVELVGFPLILRPSRTLGGSGGGIVRSMAELGPKIAHALSASPSKSVLVEESLLGWKEIELEVMRDSKDNCVIVCGIENLDPMGVHTGDSITVAPIQTLTDKEYQTLRDYSFRVMRRIGVDTGGSNVQFAINPVDGRVVIIEMNPRVSRSSALASKATGFPIAKIAAKLALGYTLDEIPNDITRRTPACFEPSIDYVVVKIPRFNFEKFEGADTTLGTQMKSVGEVMAFGRSFPEALQKAICSLETGNTGFDAEDSTRSISNSELLMEIARPSPSRLLLVGECVRRGASVGDISRASGIDPWFLTEIETLIRMEEFTKREGVSSLNQEWLRELKRYGFSDARIARLVGVHERVIRNKRHQLNVRPSYKVVDTCAAEFQATTSYVYSSYDDFSESEPLPSERKVLILGSGPNRIGQGIEFDYCCVHAVLALRAMGISALMVNCNPETVSTDYDVSDRLYFEPLTFESVMEIVERERPEGVIVQFGGQTPLKLSELLFREGVKILGTSVQSIDEAEDRERFSELIKSLGLRQPRNIFARSATEAIAAGVSLGFPVLLRPSFVLGGRAMRVVSHTEELERALCESIEVSHDRPVLVDEFLSHSIEVDVDALSDGISVQICGIMEHIERAGVHSGDSSCALPPQTLPDRVLSEIRDAVTKIAVRLRVVGLLNVQFAVKPDHTVYVLEANPRASRTIPFVGKVTGRSWVREATGVMLGAKIMESGDTSVQGCAIKSPVFPFHKFPGVDSVLGPEMKSTGEVMGQGSSFGEAFLKAQLGAGVSLPRRGTVFVSVADADKGEIVDVARGLIEIGFSLCATKGTAAALSRVGIHCEPVSKVREGSPHVLDLLGAGRIQLVINTPEGAGPHLDSRSIRLVATEMKIPTLTTVAAASAAVQAMQIKADRGGISIQSLQERGDKGPLVDREDFASTQLHM